MSTGPHAPDWRDPEDELDLAASRAARLRLPMDVSIFQEKVGDEFVVVPRLAFERMLKLARTIDSDLGFLADLPLLASADDEPKLALARKCYWLRRRRNAYFAEEMFAEPAWDLLLDLYIAGREGRVISVSSACIGASTPQTTGLRWIRNLEAARLISRAVNRVDARRVNVRLTELGVAKMDALMMEAAIVLGLD